MNSTPESSSTKTGLPAVAGTGELVHNVDTEFLAALPRSILDMRFFTEEATVWHNVDCRSTPVAESAQTMSRILRYFSDFRVEDEKSVSFNGGFVAQFRYAFTDSAGSKQTIPVCLVASLRGNHIDRIDEYVDGHQCAPLAAAVFAKDSTE